MPQNASCMTSRGFTLIEMIMVIVLSSIIAVMITSIINRPLTAYFDTSRRIALVDAAQVALTKMAVELEHAVPNSIRIDATGKILEFMPFQAAGRYRAGNAGNNNGLSVNIPDRRFNNLGDINDGISGRIVVYNTSPTTLYSDASDATPANTGVITESDNLATISDCYIDTATDSDCTDALPVGVYLEKADRITLSRNHRFDPGGSGSPGNRFYLVNNAVTYFCDTSTGELVRYEGYTISSSQVTVAATLSATATSEGKLSVKVSSCSFEFDPGNGNYRASIVSLLLGLIYSGEQVQLLKEVHLWNAP